MLTYTMGQAGFGPGPGVPRPPVVPTATPVDAVTGQWSTIVVVGTGLGAALVGFLAGLAVAGGR